MSHRVLHALQEFFLKLKSIGNADRGSKPPLIRRTKNRTTAVQDAGGVLAVECHEAHWIVKSLVSLAEADNIVSQLVGAAEYAADHGV